MSRTFGRLYPRIYDFDNLRLAWRRDRRGGKRKKPTVGTFEVDPEPNLWALHDDLATKTYQAGPYRYFTIRLPKGPTSAAPVGVCSESVI